MFYSFTLIVFIVLFFHFNSHLVVSKCLGRGAHVHCMVSGLQLSSKQIQDGWLVWIQLTPPTPGGGTWNYSHNASLGPPPLSSSYLVSSSILAPPFLGRSLILAPPLFLGEVLHFSPTPFLGEVLHSSLMDLPKHMLTND